MEIIIAVLAVPIVVDVVVLAVVPTTSRSLSLALMSVPLVDAVVVVVCDSFAAATCLRRPPTPIPNTPVRVGPKIVCECLRPVAPGNPEMLRGLTAPTEADPPPAPLPLPLSPSESSGESGGLEGSPSSGHFVVSAREAAAM